MTYMNAIATDTIVSHNSQRVAKSAPAAFRSPHYDCQHDAKSLRLVVYVPGVAAAGVDIAARGPDISVTAVKERFVRENWSALQLERVQHDYQLRLRIGFGYDLAAMTAEIENGVLTIVLPKRENVTAAAAVTLPAASRLAAAAAV